MYVRTYVCVEKIEVVILRHFLCDAVLPYKHNINRSRSTYKKRDSFVDDKQQKQALPATITSSFEYKVKHSTNKQ